MKRSIDLNCDLGESFGIYQIGQDGKIIPHVTSCNIACGFHAGDPNTMNKTVQLAVENNVAIGAHPSFPDLSGFGRRMMELAPKEIYHLVVYQIGALEGFAKVNKAKLHHVKPHGALYNLAATKMEIAEAIAEAIYDFDPRLILYGLSGSKLIEAGKKLGLTVAEEVFADRTYQPDGTLTPRTNENSLIHDKEKSVEQVLQMIEEGVVTAVDGTHVPINADTICIHGDSEHALSFVTYLSKELQKQNIQLAPLRGNHETDL